MTRTNLALVTQSEADHDQLKRLRHQFRAKQFDLLAIAREVEAISGRVDPSLLPILEDLMNVTVALSRPISQAQPRRTAEVRLLLAAQLTDLAGRVEDTITFDQLKAMLRETGAPEDLARLMDGVPQPIPDHELAAPATAEQERDTCLEALGHAPPRHSRRH